ncbi:MAG: DUF4279 domain-containing protein [Cyanobacteria bacterium SZAS LIN-3]|nr:DUF4279 domain-containing protein [Cyanobacteria bacterium SZAS LIN-3]
MQEKTNDSNSCETDVVTIPVNTQPVRVIVSISFSQENLEPAAITNLIGLTPTRCYRKGDLNGPSNVPKKQGLWSLSSAHMQSEHSICEHLNWVLDQVAEKKDILLQLLNQGNVITLKCRFGVAHWNTSFLIDSETFSRLADLNLDVSFDIFDEQTDD